MSDLQVNAIRWAGAIALAAALAHPAFAQQPNRPPQPAPVVTIQTRAGSPPALSAEEVQRQPEFPSAKAHWDALIAKASPSYSR